MAGKVLIMNNMRKINNRVTMNKSAENPATTHTHNRCLQTSGLAILERKKY